MNNYTTKFKPGDIVFTLRGLTIRSGYITDVEIKHAVQGEPEVKYFCEVAGSNAGWVEEKHGSLFASPEELTAHLLETIQ